MTFDELAKAVHDYEAMYHGWPLPGQIPGVVERLGAGSFGVAYLLEDGRVLKVALGLDATCSWISAAAQQCINHGRPGRAQPFVWEFRTCVREHTVRRRELARHQSWSRMPDGSILREPAEYKLAPVVYQKAWWFAVLEKVDAYCEVDVAEENYIVQWGRERGIISDDVYSKNCGIAEDGRFVCFDPFFNEPTDAGLSVLRDASIPYKGRANWVEISGELVAEEGVEPGMARLAQEYAMN